MFLKILEPVRSFHGLSTNLYKASDYEKLSLSLLSPLPNEQDLAINVCILLSNENKHAIKLSKCPQILHHLLAHAGVFTHRKIYLKLISLIDFLNFNLKYIF